MRIAIMLLILGILQAHAVDAYSQKTRLSLDFTDTELIKVLDNIEVESEFFFLYNEKLLDTDRKVSIAANDQSIYSILDNLFAGTDIKYSIIDRKIILAPEYLTNNNEVADLTQQQTITGIVTDSQTGNAMPGVNILVVGTSIGVITDLSGRYSILVNDRNATLRFSFIGYVAQEVALNGSSTVDVKLVSEVTGLDEVVVVGYGTQKKVNLTGSVSSVSADEIIKRQVGQASMVLQGLTPGVTITQRSGEPGSDAGTIRIRGIGTLSDANPLILVDGIASLGLNNLDPNLIESISVLKDAAASAIYGSRAANGVILVTTKRAKENVFRVSYSHYSEWQKPTDMPNKVNAVDHMTILNQALINGGASPMYDQSTIDNYASLHDTDPYTYPDVNWQKELFTENGYTQNHFLNLTGGTDRIKILAAFGYYKQGAVIVNTDFERMSMRLNSDVKFSDKFSGRIDMALLHTDKNEPGVEAETVCRWGLVNSAVEPFYIDGYGYGKPSTGDNSVADAYISGYQNNLSSTVNLNIDLKYEFFKDLFVDFFYSPTFSFPNSKTYRTKFDLYNPDGTTAVGSNLSSLSETYNRNVQNEIRTTLNFQKSLNQHNLQALAGFAQEDYSNRYISAYRDNFLLPAYDVISAGSSGNQQAGGSGSDWALRSFFGRLNYDYNGKYLFEANVRYDGSSRFAEGHKWGLFPSFSAGWRLSEENFWLPLKVVINNFKLRASWGRLGNQNIGNYPFDSFLSFTRYVRNGQSIDGGMLTSMANEIISWETTEMINFGSDISLFDRLSLTFDYYVKNTTDILLTLDVPKIIGLSAPYQNAGEVKNKGWDLGITYSGGGTDLNYDLSFVLSDVKNEIIDLKGVRVDGLQVNFEGYPMNSFYGYEAIGFFQSVEDIANSPAQKMGAVIPGNIKYKDLNDDKVIDAKDRKILGDPIPRYSYSLNADLSWKNFDLGLFLQGVGKANGYLYEAAVYPVQAGHGGTPMEMHKDSWTTENTDSKFPSNLFGSENNYVNSNFWMKNAAYMRLKNLQLGYTLPKTWINAIKIDRLRIYVSGSNLFTIDNFWDGFDVEAPVGVGGYYPQVKKYSIGVNVDF